MKKTIEKLNHDLSRIPSGKDMEENIRFYALHKIENNFQLKAYFFLIKIKNVSKK